MKQTSAAIYPCSLSMSILQTMRSTDMQHGTYVRCHMSDDICLVALWLVAHEDLSEAWPGHMRGVTPMPLPMPAALPGAWSGALSRSAAPGFCRGFVVPQLVGDAFFLLFACCEECRKACVICAWPVSGWAISGAIYCIETYDVWSLLASPGEFLLR